MYPSQPTAGNQHPDHAPPASTASRTGLTLSPAALLGRRQLEKSVSWSGREGLRCLWYRLRLTIAEMNHATRRMVELQVPWITDGPTR
jgi:hypothetical protein